MILLFKNFYCWTFNLIIYCWTYFEIIAWWPKVSREYLLSLPWASGAWRSERISKATQSPACCPAPSTQHMVHMISTGQMSESYWACMAWESPQHRTEPFAGLGELLAWDPNPVQCSVCCSATESVCPSTLIWVSSRTMQVTYVYSLIMGHWMLSASL